MHFAPQELGLLEQSLLDFLDDFEGFGFSSGDIKTDVDIDNLYEQLATLYYDICDAHRCMDAAQYLSTTSFAKRGSKVKTDNANKIKKAKELLTQIKVYISDKDMPTVLEYYNKYFKDDYNAQPQFASTKVKSRYVKASTDVEYVLTEEGLRKVKQYVRELDAKRKEILDAGKDTIDETPNPVTVEDIEEDINFTGIDEDGEYYNGWYVTDNYDADYPISLMLGVDFIEQ